MANSQYDYSQNDPRWRDVPLGFSTFWKIGNSRGNNNVSGGCLVTSAAMAASYLGHPITPDQMNTRCKGAGVINSEGDIVRNDFLQRVFPDIQYIEGKDWPNRPADLHFFDIQHDLSTEIMVKIDTKPAQGVQPHWLRVVGWDGGADVIVIDPWDGKRKGLSSYAQRHGKPVANIIYRAWKYRKHVVSPSQPAAQQPKPAPAPAPAPAQAPHAHPVTPVPTSSTQASESVVPATTSSNSQGQQNFAITYERLPEPIRMQYNKTTQVWDFGRVADGNVSSVAPVPKDGHFVAAGIAHTVKGGNFYMNAATFGDADKTGQPVKAIGVKTTDADPMDQTPDVKAEPHKLTYKEIMLKVTDAVSILTAIGGGIGVIIGLYNDIFGFLTALAAFWTGRRSHHYTKKGR